MPIWSCHWPACLQGKFHPPPLAEETPQDCPLNRPSCLLTPSLLLLRLSLLLLPTQFHLTGTLSLSLSSPFLPLALTIYLWLRYMPLPFPMPYQGDLPFDSTQGTLWQADKTSFLFRMQAPLGGPDCVLLISVPQPCLRGWHAAAASSYVLVA